MKHWGRKMWREQLAKLCGEYVGIHSRSPQTPDRPLVLHWAFIGGSLGLMNREILMALGLNARGGRSRIVLCDGVASGCQIRSYCPDDSFEYWKKVCGNCVQCGEKLMESSGLEAIKLSSLLTGEQIRHSRELADSVEGAEIAGFEMNGYPLGHYAMAATTRYFRSLPYMVPAGEFEPVLREYLYTGLLSMHASVAARNQLQPDIVLTTHNIYSEWGPAYRTFSNWGTPVYWHISSILQNHIMIRRSNGDHTSHPYYSDHSTWEMRKTRELSESQERALDQFMEVICEGKNSLFDFFGEPPQAPEVLRERYDIPLDKKVWGIFSPLAWDAHLSADPLLFGDVDEWLVQTVRCAASIKDVIWLVKIHPTESLRQSRVSMQQILEEAFPTLPENIRLIPGSERVNTHGLIALLDGGITTRGTTGLELALQGKQAMTAGYSHYGFKGFTLDCRTVEDYFSHMKNAPNLGALTPEQIILARRYAYDFFIRRNLPFEIYDQRQMKVNKAVFDALNNGQATVMSSICDDILFKASGSLERPEKEAALTG
jgi:hypothetical protein